jgi:hypothetical protein
MRICIKIYGSCERELKSRFKLQQENLKQDLLDFPECVIIPSCLESLESKPASCCLQLFVHYCVLLLKPYAWFVDALFCCMLWQTVFKTTPEVLLNRPKKKTKNLQFPSKSRTAHDAKHIFQCCVNAFQWGLLSRATKASDYLTTRSWDQSLLLSWVRFGNC